MTTGRRPSSQPDQIDATDSSTARTETAKEKARGRWKLLREAVINRVVEPQESCSIHAFRGFNLLVSRRVHRNEAESQRLIDALSQLKCPSASWTLEALRQEFRLSITAITALLSSEPAAGGNEVIEIALSPALPGEMMLNVASLESSIDGMFEEDEHGSVQCKVVSAQAIRVCLSTQSAYSAHEFTIDASDVRVLTRQRTERRVNLKDLVSHHHHDGVDNTGNICVWDSEKTLAWVLLQESSESTVNAVTEVGIGMAGLGGLVLAVKGISKSLVRLTDGHNSCVWNNQVSLRITAVANQIKTGQPMIPVVECQQLLWTSSSVQGDDQRFRPQADWTLASDCTHFEDQHGNLLWTLLECTKSGGLIWLCQPERGSSLGRFLALIEFVNQHASRPLVRIQERLYRGIEQKHRVFLRSSGSYNPNIHKPVVFVLEKRRDASEVDLRLIQECLDARTMKSGGYDTS